MSMFKKKTEAPQTANARATILPLDSGYDPINETMTYVVSIESNMADLVNENVNDIEIISEIKAPSPIAGVNIQTAGDILEQSTKRSSTSKTKKIGSIDPKMTVSHGDLGTLSQSKIKDNVIRENLIFSERKFEQIPFASNMNIDDVIKQNTGFDRSSSVLQQTSTFLSAQFDSSTALVTRGYMSPLVKEKSEKIISNKTSILSTVTISKNEQIRVNLKDPAGRTVGRVGKSAKNIEKNVESGNDTKYLKPFKILNSNTPFSVNVSSDEYGFYLHVTSRFASLFPTFEIFARNISTAPISDRYSSLGIYSTKNAKKIILATTGTKSLMFQIVPIYNKKKLCWSQTYVHPGIESPAASKIISYQTDVDGETTEALCFKIYNYPLTARKIYAVRTNALSGKKTRFDYSKIEPKEDLIGLTNKAYTWVDSNIGFRNNTYSYDFFAIDKYGFETHLGNHTTRTYEKDISGIRFSSASSSKSFGTHILNFTVYIPDLWFPQPGDDLLTPGDSIFEACRANKKIGLLQLVRHSSVNATEIIDTFVINPAPGINDIPVEITDQRSISGKFIIDSAFATKYGLSDIYNNVEYTYELRAGYYSLGNELSFLNNPIKLTVPNEFTNGKTGYSYHPYLFESPLSKDFSIIPKLGEPKSTLKLEALTNTSKIYIFDATNNIGKIPSLRCTRGANKSGKNTIIPYAIIQSNLSRDIAEVLDHVEILVANSTTGKWLTLGKHKLTSNKFYFVDSTGPTLAANKIKYLLIGRNTAFEEIFRTTSQSVSLKKYNYSERQETTTNSVSTNQSTNNQLG